MCGNATPMMMPNAMMKVPTLRLITESLSKKGCALNDNSLQSSFESESLSSVTQSAHQISCQILEKENNVNVVNIKKRKNMEHNNKRVGAGEGSKSKRRHLNSEVVLLSYEERVLQQVSVERQRYHEQHAKWQRLYEKIKENRTGREGEGHVKVG